MQVALSLCNVIESLQGSIDGARGSAAFELLKVRQMARRLYMLPFDHRDILRHEAIRMERRLERRAGGGDHGRKARSSTTAFRPPLPAAHRGSTPPSWRTSDSAQISCGTPVVRGT